MITIELPWEKPPIRSNGSRGEHRAHAAKVRNAREAAAVCGRAYFMANGELPSPCIVTMIWTVSNRIERDSMNLAWTMKPCIDGFVDAGLWSKDHFGIIPEARQRIEYVKGKAGVRVEILGVEGL